MIKVVKAVMIGEDGLHGGGEDELHGDGEEEDDKEYFYDDWGVDYVDLDFKTGKNNKHCSRPD